MKLGSNRLPQPVMDSLLTSLRVNYLDRFPERFHGADITVSCLQNGNTAVTSVPTATLRKSVYTAGMSIEVTAFEQ